MGRARLADIHVTSGPRASPILSPDGHPAISQPHEKGDVDDPLLRQVMPLAAEGEVVQAMAPTQWVKVSSTISPAIKEIPRARLVDLYRQLRSSLPLLFPSPLPL